MSLQREFIRQSIEYYVKSGCTESEAEKHANADAKWWRAEFSKILENKCVHIRSTR